MENFRTLNRCEVCRRVLAVRSLTIVHDDLGEHELCAPCEEVFSLNVMKYFGRELAQFGYAIAEASRGALRALDHLKTKPEASL